MYPKFTLALLVMSMAVLGHADHGKQQVHCERLIDGLSDQVLLKQTVTIEHGKFTSIEPGFSDNKNAIYLENATCMPGLIDMHVHITSELNPARFADRFRLDPADYAFASVQYAQKTLDAGFTTVRDLGSASNLAIKMRNAINKGHIVGPRIYAAGKSLATTGGHADPSNGTNAHLIGDPGPKQGVVNSPADARKAVRQRYKDGADLIKITATGGVLSQASSGQNAQFTEQELTAIISTAKDYGFAVAAHAHGTEGMKRAIKAGVASIEHGTYMDKEVMRLMKKNGTYYVPTIMAGKFVAEKAELDNYFSALVKPKAKAIGPLIQSTFARAYKSGVKIAFGTDTGVSAHGDNWKEFVYMVEAGMPAMEAIRSATFHAATLLGQIEHLGTVSKGKHADLVIVRGNPLQQIENMQHVDMVMKAGVVYRLL